MTLYGVTDTGFLKKTLSEILAEIEEEEKARISASLNVLASSVLGQINGIFADKLRELWDVAEAVYRSQYPDSANADALEQLCALTGINRKGPRKSTVLLERILLDDGTTLPIGSIVSVGVQGNRFVTLEEAVNASGFTDLFSVHAESELYGPIPGYAATIDSIVSPVSGWTAKAAMKASAAGPYAVGSMSLIVISDEEQETVNFPAGGPYTAQECADFINADFLYAEGFDADGTLLIASKTDGTGSSIKAKDFGGSNANTVFLFPTTEVKGMNSLDAELGRNLETDPELRERRELSLSQGGSGTVDALRADLLELSYVLQCFIFENDTDVTDGDGLPPHSFEAVVLGGDVDDEQEIAETIWSGKPAGIATYGDISKTVEDSQGVDHVVKFSRPTEVPLYLELTVEAVEEDFPDDGADQIKNALKALADAQEVGGDVIALRYMAEPLDVSGVMDVTVFKIDIVYPPLNTGNIPIASRELATLALTDIDLTVVWSTP